MQNTRAHTHPYMWESWLDIDSHYERLKAEIGMNQEAKKKRKKKLTRLLAFFSDILILLSVSDTVCSKRGKK